jgi:hypothetical protein
MAEIHYIRGSSAPKVTEDQALENASTMECGLGSGAESAAEAGLYCAYNETRQSFVATNVDVADGAGGAADARLHTMEPGSGLALWISPFRSISPSCARFPLDLVFLDKGSTVLETVEFFPMSVGGEASAQAASILVLAADSLAQVQVKAGDRLTIAARQEMLHRLPRPKDAESGATQSAAQVATQNSSGDAQEGRDGLSGKQPVSGTQPVNDAGPVNGTEPVKAEEPLRELTATREDHDRNTPAQNAAEMPETKERPETREPAAAANGNNGGAAQAIAAQLAEKKETELAAKDPDQIAVMPGPGSIPGPISAAIPSSNSVASTKPAAIAEDLQVAPHTQREPWKKDEPRRTWLQRLLLGDNPDPRRFARKATPELVAYFFTGGTPMQHPVRDISNSGLYIVTHERWFHGTIVQMTLSESHRRQGAQSISLFAKVVRSGRDGVGLRFVLEGIDRRKARRYDLYEPTNGISVARVSEFVDQLKAS